MPFGSWSPQAPFLLWATARYVVSPPRPAGVLVGHCAAHTWPTGLRLSC
jgi:hypothetical protein